MQPVLDIALRYNLIEKPVDAATLIWREASAPRRRVDRGDLLTVGERDERRDVGDVADSFQVARRRRGEAHVVALRRGQHLRGPHPPAVVGLERVGFGELIVGRRARRRSGHRSGASPGPGDAACEVVQRAAVEAHAELAHDREERRLAAQQRGPGGA